jgi:hypothetical protein
MSRPTFGTLRQVLLDLGFQTTTMPKGHIRFDHAPSDTLVILRSYKEHEPVDEGNLVGIRRLLDEKGVIDREKFDELLRERSLARQG